MIYPPILFGLFIIISLQVHRILASEGNEHVFTNSWAVQMDTSDVTVADEVASSFGFVSRGAIDSLPSYFEFVHERTPNRKKRSAEQHTKSLMNHPRVLWAQQQTLLHRYKRGHHRQAVASRAEQNKRFFNDPKWSEQWYLYDDGENNRRNLRVLDAVQLGYSGKGVVVSILDDGLDHAHPDLKQNYDAKASTDLNDKDDDPTPNATNPSNDHGTKCGGEVAAEANNNVCGVGVAYKASLGGIRMLDGPITDLTEATALNFRHHYVDIKSASWGPMDDGKTFGKPQKLAENALRMSAEKGRGGKGTIFVWATGNGGRSNDDCNCDGYTSSIYTLSIGSITPAGFSTFYGEMCPSTLAVVYTGDIGPNSRNFGQYDNLITTTLHNKCAESFSGTSCAAPLAAGIFALVLEANPHLTWRDVQHLVVDTAEKNNPESRTWHRNAAGKEYSRAYGFGVLNARSLVLRAKDWTQVGKQLKRTFPGHGDYGVIPWNGKQILQIKVPTPQQGYQSRITKLEHVQLVMSVTHRKRGNLEIKLESPAGTNSILLSRRPLDISTDGLTDWPFMSLEFWGENPEGVWNLTVSDVQTQDILLDENSSQGGEFKYPSGVSISDLQHGRFKEDYMKTAAKSKQPKWFAGDESLCSQRLGAGCITQWTLIIYGTA